MTCIICYIYDIKRNRYFPKLLRVPTMLFCEAEYQKCRAKGFLFHKNVFVATFLKELNLAQLSSICFVLCSFKDTAFLWNSLTFRASFDFFMR